MFFNKKKINNSENNPKILKTYYDILDSIMHDCWDGETYTFNWKNWFDRRDEIIWCNVSSVLKQIDYEFAACGWRQVGYINALLENMFVIGGEEVRKDILLKIQNLESDILLNLRAMFSFENGQCNENICSDKVVKYREYIYKIIHGNIPLEKERIKEIINLGNEIHRLKLSSVRLYV
jgi:hypothetical protein